MTPTWLKTTSLLSFAAGLILLGLGVNARLTPTATAASTGLELPALDPKVLADTAPATTSQPAVELAATDSDALAKAAENALPAIVTGTVEKVEVSSSGKVAKITFQGAKGKGAFTAAYFTKFFDAMDKQFGKNAKDLAGQKVRLTGTLQMFKGAPELVIKDLSQLQVIK